MSGVRYVRYYKRRWNKTLCGICWCTVSRHYVNEHALYHHKSGQSEDKKREGTGAAYGDAHIYSNTVTGDVVQFNGWFTESTGPR